MPKRRKKPKVEAKCNHCGNVYYVSQWYLPKTRFCSRRCTAFAKTTEERASLVRAVTTHGMNRTPEWRAWMGMRHRCKPGGCYEKYGITVCEEWKVNFTAFYEHIGPYPGPGHSLDRYPKANGNYEPGNVRWATSKEQGWSKVGKKAKPTTRRKMSLKQRGENNATAKVTEVVVREIRAQEGNKSKHELAAEFGIATSTVRDIQTHRSWRHL